jgi:hypothetical protein
MVFIRETCQRLRIKRRSSLLMWTSGSAIACLGTRMEDNETIWLADNSEECNGKSNFVELLVSFW